MHTNPTVQNNSGGLPEARAGVPESEPFFSSRNWVIKQKCAGLTEDTGNLALVVGSPAGVPIRVPTLLALRAATT